MPKNGVQNMSISAYISKVQSHFWLKFGRALALLSFYRNRWFNLMNTLGSKVLDFDRKLSLAKKISPKTTLEVSPRNSQEPWRKTYDKIFLCCGL